MPLLGRLHQSPRHRIALDVAQFLNPFLLRTNVEVIKSCLPNDGQPPNRLKGPGVIIPSAYISFPLVTRLAQMYDLVVTLNVSGGAT